VVGIERESQGLAEKKKPNAAPKQRNQILNGWGERGKIKHAQKRPKVWGGGQ